jgi:hypothetical protein
MTAKFFVIVAAFVVSGCGVVAKVDARNDMMQSKQAYTDCLRANSAEPQSCAGLKEAYEADLQAYRATSSGIRPGYAVSVDQSSN